MHLSFENCYKNQNVAAALRTAECLGVQNVHLIRGEGHNSNQKRVDTNLSKSAERWLDVHYHSSTADFLTTVKACDSRVYAAHFDPTAAPIGAIPDLNLGVSTQAILQLRVIYRCSLRQIGCCHRVAAGLTTPTATVTAQVLAWQCQRARSAWSSATSVTVSAPRCRSRRRPSSSCPQPG